VVRLDVASGGGGYVHTLPVSEPRDLKGMGLACIGRGGRHQQLEAAGCRGAECAALLGPPLNA
jgi:hypothetical protein